MKPIIVHGIRAIVSIVSALVLQGTASAAVIFPKVTNTNNSGSGSLRAAITASNANGADGAIISFDIGSGCGPHVIHLATALPDLTAEVHVEGYTQPGASKNTLNGYSENNAAICIVLAGDNAVDDGLAVPASVADAMEMSVQGVAFSGFTHSALNLRGGSHHVVAGIRTGGSLGGFALQTNSYGVILAAGVHGATIGGPDPGDFNQLGDITHNAVYIASSTASSVAAHGNLIQNNIIGYVVDSPGISVSLPTIGAGIAVGGYNNSIFDNQVSYAGASGLHISNLDAHGNSVNYNGFFQNTGDGVLVDDDAHDNQLFGNGIFDSLGAGVRIVNGQNNEIIFNNIDYNTGLGIDLANAGVTPNDNDSMQPAPDYANRGQNFPTITAAAGGHTGIVSGTLTTTPGDYYINVYGTTSCSDSGDRSGQNYFSYPVFGSFSGFKVTVPNITAQGQGSISFSIPVTLESLPNDPLSVTATTTNSTGNTSEYSACLLYANDTIFYDGFE
ncbi:MAG: right-handed parallel beta-helix repeat-containing protein [Rudaea sp.]